MIDFPYEDYESGSFTWDPEKETTNVIRHGINFAYASRAFVDPNRMVLEDMAHSAREPRFFCVGLVDGKVMAVRFAFRENEIRIIGAGYWRKWRKYYEKKKSS